MQVLYFFLPESKEMPKDVRHKERLEPLHVQLQKDHSVELAPKAPRQKQKKHIQESDIVNPKMTQKILKMIQEQQEEEEEEENEEKVQVQVKPIVRQKIDSDSDSEKEFEEFETEEAELEIDENDQKLMDKFMNPSQRLNLSEMIMSKLGNESEPELKMNPKVVEVYTKVGLLLSRYKSGPMPKTFKILPTLRDWEEVLYITNPQDWTPQATYQATRLFASNLKSKMAQRFYNLILLEKVRDDINENKKLNYHLYMALKKAVYKPAAFFKGILLPLCESGNCTLREAAILGSVLIKVSVPVLHSAAALLKLADMDYTGPNSLFIRILLDKKYALPFKVIDSLVFHFLQFKNDEREMPVLWHQSMLVFAQRYC
jgi:essential nuclear protein 1